MGELYVCLTFVLKMYVMVCMCMCETEMRLKTKMVVIHLPVAVLGSRGGVLLAGSVLLSGVLGGGASGVLGGGGVLGSGSGLGRVLGGSGGVLGGGGGLGGVLGSRSGVLGGGGGLGGVLGGGGGVLGGGGGTSGVASGGLGGGVASGGLGGGVASGGLGGSVASGGLGSGGVASGHPRSIVFSPSSKRGKKRKDLVNCTHQTKQLPPLFLFFSLSSSKCTWWCTAGSKSTSSHPSQWPSGAKNTRRTQRCTWGTCTGWWWCSCGEMC